MTFAEGQYVIVTCNDQTGMFGHRAKIVNVFTKRVKRRKIQFLYLDLRWNSYDIIREVILSQKDVIPIPDHYRLLKYHEIIEQDDCTLYDAKKPYWYNTGRWNSGMKAYMLNTAVIRKVVK